LIFSWLRSQSASEEPAAQKEWLNEEVEKLGHSVIFYPKYHCELNVIENFGVGLSQVIARIALRSCFRFMNAYRLGLVCPLLDYAIENILGIGASPEGI